MPKQSKSPLKQKMLQKLPKKLSMVSRTFLYTKLGTTRKDFKEEITNRVAIKRQNLEIEIDARIKIKTREIFPAQTCNATDAANNIMPNNALILIQRATSATRKDIWRLYARESSINQSSSSVKCIKKAELIKAIFDEEIKESPKLDVPISIENKDFTIELDTATSGNFITVPVWK